MFPFEKLEVYHLAKKFALKTRTLLKVEKLDYGTENQLRRASTSIILNIAEGSSKPTFPDRRRFYAISRGSSFECYAIMELLEESGEIEINKSKKFKGQLIQISKILFGLMKA